MSQDSHDFDPYRPTESSDFGEASHGTVEYRPQGLKGTTTVFAVVLLVFGLIGLPYAVYEVMGAILSPGSFSMQVPKVPNPPGPANAPVDQTADQTADQKPEDSESGEATGTRSDDATGPETVSTSSAPQFKLEISPVMRTGTIVLGIIDALVSLALIVLSIQVLMKKRRAAIQLSNLCWILILLTIVKTIFLYMYMDDIVAQFKASFLQEAQKGSMKPGQLEQVSEAFTQVVRVVTAVCSGFFAFLIGLFYLMAALHLRRPTTLERMKDPALA